MQHNIIQSYQTGGGALVGNLAVTGDTEINSDVVLSAAASNIELDVAFTRSKVQSLALFCTADCTVKTNSTSQPADTKSLTANQPAICESTSEVESYFAGGDITKLYLSCTAGGTFSLRVLLDEEVPPQ